MTFDEGVGEALAVLADIVNRAQVEGQKASIPQSLWFEARRALCRFVDGEFSTDSIRTAVRVSTTRVMRTGNPGPDAAWAPVLVAPNRATATLRMVQLATQEAGTMPNNPFVDQSGPDEVSIYIGLYKVATYKVEVA